MSSWGYVLLFLLPSLIGTLLFVLLPTVASAVMSLTQWSVIDTPLFVGMKNYTTLLTDDPIFWGSLGATLRYALMSIPVSLSGALGLAVIVNQPLKGMTFFRVILFIPVVSSMVSVAMIWRWLLAVDFGLVNIALMTVGLPQVHWLTNPKWVLAALALISVWKGLGYGMIIYLAALQAVPAHLYEAASIDGATSWQRFWRITFPLLAPTHFFMLVTGVIGSFQVFDTVYLMTRGGPGNASRVYAFYLWQQAFSYYHMGYASAMAWILFLIIFVITIAQVRLLEGGVTYELA